jgi:hypothetical protein
MLKIIYRESFLCSDQVYRTAVTGLDPYGETKAIRVSAIIEQLDPIFFFHFFHGPLDPVDILALKEWDENNIFVKKEILGNTIATKHRLDGLYNSESEYSNLTPLYLHINTVDKILDHEFRGTKEELKELYPEEDIHPENLIILKTK